MATRTSPSTIRSVVIPRPSGRHDCVRGPSLLPARPYHRLREGGNLLFRLAPDRPIVGSASLKAIVWSIPCLVQRMRPWLTTPQ